MTAPSKEALAAWDALTPAQQMYGPQSSFCHGFDAGRKSFADGLVPVAWLHDQRPDADVITNSVRDVWLAALPKQVEHYTTPLYALPKED